ncbi:MAG: peptidase T [Clostridiales bacterium]|jgi:tripeptide aminopeptidase|nr:peptidase T [Clostridiales bacterium]
METVRDRFLRYVKYDTQADGSSGARPSSTGQTVFAELLVSEAAALGLSDVAIEDGVVYARLPGSARRANTVGFIAHMDTSPDASGKGVSPRVLRYDGGEVPLGGGLALSPDEFPELSRYAGQEIIVTDGTTLLGADDKAGVAEIMTALDFLIANPGVPRGDISVAFTPDEEIGEGADGFDYGRFGADFAYTIDGGGLGELNYECFNASKAVVTFVGKSVHPGSAKGVMVNAAQLAAEFASSPPKDERPETTDALEGFYHIHEISGNVERARVELIIRDFDADALRLRERFVLDTAKALGGTAVITPQYRNMAVALTERPQAAELAERAYAAVGVTPDVQPIRGGTDGARFCEDGLPCPNIFTGGHNFHGPFEYIAVPSMETAVRVIVKIAELAD